MRKRELVGAATASLTLKPRRDRLITAPLRLTSARHQQLEDQRGHAYCSVALSLAFIPNRALVLTKQSTVSPKH